MFKRKTRIKKIIAISLVALAAAISCFIPLSKADDSGYLALILQDTGIIKGTTNNILVASNNILTAINQIPVLLNPLTELALALVPEDKSDPTASLQNSFTTLNNAYLMNMQTTLDTQKPLLNDFFKGQSLTYVNDLVYGTLWNSPYISPDPREDKPDAALNYVKNASGLSIKHSIPNFPSKWKGSSSDITNYENYFKTISAVQTFNTFILSQAYANKQNGYQFTNTQLALIKQASDAKDWFAAVASEHIGIVIRQILMYESQIYLTLTQLLQTQQQAVIAQSMTNTLLILGNQFTEDQLVGKATGSVPR